MSVGEATTLEIETVQIQLVQITLRKVGFMYLAKRELLTKVQRHLTIDSQNHLIVRGLCNLNQGETELCATKITLAKVYGFHQRRAGLD